MNATIESLDGHLWPEPGYHSGLVVTAHALRKKPISELTPNDLRVAFNEDIGTPYLRARVIEVLEHNALSGDLFDGDLILAVAGSRQFKIDEPFRLKIIQLAGTAPIHDLDLGTLREIEKLKMAEIPLH